MSQTPTVSSNSLQAANLLQRGNLLKVIVGSGFNNDIQIANELMPPLAAVGTPTFNPVAGSYGPAQSVTISAENSTSIWYTTDGSTPTYPPTGTTQQYIGAITVSATETVQAIGIAAGYSDSSVGSAAYTINGAVSTPTFSPAAGTYTSGQSVTISAPNSTSIWYTTDGSTPTYPATGTTQEYTGPGSVGTSETINAIGVAAGYSNSAVGSAAYTINLILFQWNATDLTQFSVQGNSPSFDSGFGNPSSPVGTDTNSIATNANGYFGLEGSNYFESGQTLQFDIYLNSSGSPYNEVNVGFACNSAGTGPALGISESGRGNTNGFYACGNWESSPAGGLAQQIGTGAWYSMRIELNGTTAKWYIYSSGTWNLIQTATVSPNGQYSGWASVYSGGWITNISVLPYLA
jgi:hypothetical protein